MGSSGSVRVSRKGRGGSSGLVRVSKSWGHVKDTPTLTLTQIRYQLSDKLQVKAMFIKSDLDGSGFIDQTEFREVFVV